MRAKVLKLQNYILWTALTMALIAVIIVITAINSKPLESRKAVIPISVPTVILDAGHGGIDGGAVSESGIKESDINLKITFKTFELMKLLGLCPIMTRDNGNSLDYNPENSTRANKNADLKKRLDISENLPTCDFLSIHLNKFEQSRYFGAQVFYGEKNMLSKPLAEHLQKSLVGYIDNGNTRAAKKSHDSVYLMKNIEAPAVTIECGFLSNADEANRLKTDIYQTHLAIAITCGYIDYIKER